MSDELVSVIMAAHNSERWIEAAIRSIQGQTHANWELIVVDDGSTDRTLALASNFVDNRIKVFALDANMGSGFARNFALHQAKGKYFAVADADDLSLPNRLELQLQAFGETSGIELVSGQTIDRDARGRLKFGHWTTNNATASSQLALQKMPIAHCTAMFKTESVLQVGGYCIELKRAQDFCLLLKMHGPHLRVLSAPLVIYRHESPESLRYILASGRAGLAARQSVSNNAMISKRARPGLALFVCDLKSTMQWIKENCACLFRTQISSSWLNGYIAALSSTPHGNSAHVGK